MVHKVVAFALIAVELGTADVAYCPGRAAVAGEPGRTAVVNAMAIVSGMDASA